MVGTLTPEQPLSTLHDASNPNGTWILRVCDDTGSDLGDVRFVKVNIVPCESPVAGGQTIVPACGTNEFSIDVNLTSLGSSATIDLTNDFDANVVTANATGIWTVGPFPSGTTVTVTLEATNALCDVTLTPQTYNCPPPNDLCANAARGALQQHYQRQHHFRYSGSAPAWFLWHGRNRSGPVVYRGGYRWSSDHQPLRQRVRHQTGCVHHAGLCDLHLRYRQR
ncbi:MAG: hypothetical protein IPL77_14235 [Flavobacteriales bacterium]|nr:hypothetical protein [Flavobacteriales bacterium]